MTRGRESPQWVLGGLYLVSEETTSYHSPVDWELEIFAPDIARGTYVTYVGDVAVTAVQYYSDNLGENATLRIFCTGDGLRYVEDGDVVDGLERVR